MGDVLHALPAVAAMKRQHPDWVVDWVVDERWRALLTDENTPGPIVRRTFVARTRAWKKAPFSAETIRDVLSFRRLRGEYDVVIDMQGTMRSAVLGRLAGGRQLVGYADPRETLAARLYGHRVGRRGTHVVEQGFGLLVKAVGMANTASKEEHSAVVLPRIAWAEEWAEREAVLARPQAVLAPSAGWGSKQWPVERFGELAVRLRERGFEVVVNAVRKDDSLPLRVVEASGGAARMVVCNVAGLVALMRRTDLLVGGDSGPVHLAAALAVPTVALFGPTSRRRNGPWGPGPKVVLRHQASVTTYKRTAETDPGLARISVEQVMAAVESL